MINKYALLAILPLWVGCCTKCLPPPEFKPLAPKKFQNLVEDSSSAAVRCPWGKHKWVWRVTYIITKRGCFPHRYRACARCNKRLAPNDFHGMMAYKSVTKKDYEQKEFN